MTSSDSAILFTVEDGLAHITLNRPNSLNAIDAEAAGLWADIAGEVASRDDIGAVLFDATGRAFCAGGDVASMAQADGSLVTRLAEVINVGHTRLLESAKPIVAAVHGSVVGGGLGFMLTADVIVAAESTVFASKYADIGLVPDCGVSVLLPQAVGMRRALELTLTDRRLTAAEAAEWGLVTETVADAELAPRALAVAQGWLAGATYAFGQARRLVRASTTRSLAESLADEAISIGAAADTPEARARIQAFAAGRAR